MGGRENAKPGLMRLSFLFLFILISTNGRSQITWRNVDSAYQPLPASIRVFYCDQPLDSTPFRAYYVAVDLKDRKLRLSTDTTQNRRLTPAAFYQRNQDPLVVVNGTFFSFSTNQNLNVVINKRRLLGYQVHTLPRRGKDTFTYHHPVTGAIGFSKSRKADVAWIYTDSIQRKAYPSQWPVPVWVDSLQKTGLEQLRIRATQHDIQNDIPFSKKWDVQTAIGGGPVLMSGGRIRITNNEELKFTGKALYDKHPRTAMGYTADHQLIILVIEGRNPAASGADLAQEAQIMKDLGCVEALNLDGGGSSCLLVNGKETIKPSDKAQRPVPAVFMVRKK